MGDDSNNEYLYKFVSDAVWDPADANPSDRLATGAKYGPRQALRGALRCRRHRPLAVARPGTATTGGSTLGALYGDLAGIILNTRGAGDAVGATPMDRPEWTAVNPSMVTSMSP